MKKIKQKIEEPNVIKTYDAKGNLTSYYWQNEPITVRTGMGFSIPKRKWWNPIWRIKQYRMIKKPIKFTDPKGGQDDEGK